MRDDNKLSADSQFQQLPIPVEGDVLIIEYLRGERGARVEKKYRDGKWVVIWSSDEARAAVTR